MKAKAEHPDHPYSAGNTNTRPLSPNLIVNPATICLISSTSATNARHLHTNGPRSTSEPTQEILDQPVQPSTAADTGGKVSPMVENRVRQAKADVHVSQHLSCSKYRRPETSFSNKNTSVIHPAITAANVHNAFEAAEVSTGTAECRKGNEHTGT